MDKIKIIITIFSALILIQAVMYFETSWTDGLLLISINTVAAIALAKGTENV